MFKSGKGVVHSIALGATLKCAAVSNAAEGFEPRYNRAGSLGGRSSRCRTTPDGQAGRATPSTALKASSRKKGIYRSRARRHVSWNGSRSSSAVPQGGIRVSRNK
jgi:hypothetical protein